MSTPTLKALAQAATPGPWTTRQQFANRWLIEKRREGFVPTTIAAVHTTTLEVGTGREPETGANAQLIARLSPPVALAVYEALVIAQKIIKGARAFCHKIDAARINNALALLDGQKET